MLPRVQCLVRCGSHAHVVAMGFPSFRRGISLVCVAIALQLASANAQWLRTGCDTSLAESPPKGFQALLSDKHLALWANQEDWQLQRGWLSCRKHTTDKTAILTLKEQLPPNCELRFEWQASGRKPLNNACPGFALNYSSVDGTKVDYQVANIALRLGVGGIDRNFGELHTGSWSVVTSALWDFSKPIGQLNSGRIYCVDSRICFSLNGKVVFDVDLDKAARTEKNKYLELAAENWKNRGKNGLHLQIVCYHVDSNLGPLARIRSLQVRELSQRQFRESMMQFRRGECGRIDWEKHCWFRKLVIPRHIQSSLHIRLTVPGSFRPVHAITNPGATRDMDVIRCYTSDLYHDAIGESDIRAMFMARYRMDSKPAIEKKVLADGRVVNIASAPIVTVTSWELTSASVARQLFSHLNGARAGNDMRVFVILNNVYVTYVSAPQSVSTACFEGVRLFLERAIAERHQ